MCDGIPKPKMRGLLATQISLHLTIGATLSILTGLAYKFFVIDKRQKQVREYYLYLRCRNYGWCPATAKMRINNLDFIEPIRDHDDGCEPFENAEIIVRFKNALRESLVHHWYKLRELYDSLSLVYPEASALVPYSTIRSSMLRWRAKSFPPSPRDLRSFGDSLLQIHEGGVLEYTHGRLRTRNVTDNDGCIHVLFYDEEFIMQEFREVTSFLVDATFSTTPEIENCMQLLSVLGIKYNHAIPAFWALMSRKTKTAYEKCLAAFRFIVGGNAQVIMADFEVALREACRQLFPEARIAGCNVHFDRAIYHKLRELQLQNIIREDNDVSATIKKIISLAFLPHEDIVDTFNEIINTLTPATRAILIRFITYFRRQWIGIVTPKGFSIFGLQRRTNNAIESYHARLGARIGLHPSPWAFTCSLLGIIECSVSDVLKLSRGLQARRLPRYQARFRAVQLNRLWKLYVHRRLTKVELMTIVSNLKGNISRKIQQLENIENELRSRYDEEFGNVNVANANEIDPEFDYNVIINQPLEREVHEVRRMIGVQFQEEENERLDMDFDREVIGEADAAAQEFLEIPVPAWDDPPAQDMLVPAIPEQHELQGPMRNRRRRRRRGRRVQQPRIPNAPQEEPPQPIQGPPSCVCCLVNTSDHAFIPCGHKCCCRACVDRVFIENARCPFCRAEAETFLRVFDV